MTIYVHTHTHSLVQAAVCKFSALLAEFLGHCCTMVVTALRGYNNSSSREDSAYRNWKKIG